MLIILSDPHKREWLYLINTQDNFKRFLWKGQASYKKSITYRDKGSVKDKSWNVMPTKQTNKDIDITRMHDSQKQNYE